MVLVGVNKNSLYPSMEMLAMDSPNFDLILCSDIPITLKLCLSRERVSRSSSMRRSSEAALR